MANSRKSSLGFTLVEILFSIAIVGVASVMGAQLLTLASRSSVEIEVVNQFGIIQMEIESALEQKCQLALQGQNTASQNVQARFDHTDFQGTGLFNKTLAAGQSFGEFSVVQVGFPSPPVPLDGGTFESKLQYSFRSNRAPWIRENLLIGKVDLVVWPLTNSTTILTCARSKSVPGSLLRAGMAPGETWSSATFYPAITFCQMAGYPHETCDIDRPGTIWAWNQLKTLVEP